jgi:hypothetical protein
MDKYMEGRDPVTGARPPEELSDEEIARRIDEKAAMQTELGKRRGVRIDEPIARPRHATDHGQAAEAAAQAEHDAATVRDRIAQLEVEISQWKKLEIETRNKSKAEADAKRLELGQAQAEAQRRLDEARAVQNTATMYELADDTAQQPSRNRALAEAGTSESREAMKRLVEPWRHEVSYAMRRIREIDQQYRRALETFATLTTSTAPANFPAHVKNQLSARVYRPAEAVLIDINNFLACSVTEPELRGQTLEAVLTEIATTGIWTGGTAALKFWATQCWTRDLVDSIRTRIDTITSELARLYKEGREAAGDHQSEPDPRIADDAARQAAKREAQYGKLVGGRQGEADMTWDR